MTENNLSSYKKIIESMRPTKVDRAYMDALRHALEVHGGYVDIYMDKNEVFVDIEEQVAVYEFRLSKNAILNF